MFCTTSLRVEDPVYAGGERGGAREGKASWPQSVNVGRRPGPACWDRTHENDARRPPKPQQNISREVPASG